MALMNLKSNYILKQIFAHIKINIFLNIIRYNKLFQQKLNKDINDYKLNSKTIIDIIPESNSNDKFINLIDENRIHIYFDNNPEEIKRNCLKEDETIKKIKILIDHDIKTFKALFKKSYSIQRMKIISHNNNIEDMSYMFEGCIDLKELDLSHFCTKNVKNMDSMFCGCSKLEKLNISNFNTEKVENMANLFNQCSSLKELDISAFNTHIVRN